MALRRPTAVARRTGSSPPCAKRACPVRGSHAHRAPTSWRRVGGETGLFRGAGWLHLGNAAPLDRSQIRHRTSVLKLDMMRRAVASHAQAWIRRCPSPRAATKRGFDAAAAARQAPNAFRLVSTSYPSGLPKPRTSLGRKRVRISPHLSCQVAALMGKLRLNRHESKCALARLILSPQAGAWVGARAGGRRSGAPSNPKSCNISYSIPP